MDEEHVDISVDEEERWLENYGTEPSGRKGTGTV